MVKRKEATLLLSILALLSAVALSGGPLSGVARAADPDVRSIRPAVMLLVDSSLSMEYMPGYVPSGASRGCAAAGACPVCNGVVGEPRNRWTTTLEALTGNFSSFTCVRQGDASGYRTTAMFVGQYDYRAQVPYHQPNGPQLSDGILDSYIDRVKFGLMTFDGAGGLVPTATPYLGVDVPQATYLGGLARMNTADGMYSYGRNVPYSYPPPCASYMMNNGARSKDAAAGGLVSVGNDLADFRAINAQIQARLLATRPYGGTPIAGMLDDAKYWLQTDPDIADPRSVAGGDPLYQCRSRYLLLLTDGYPDSDKRTGSVNCEQAGGVCPYARAEELSDDLCQLDASGKCQGLVDGVFVVGLSVSDPANVARLNLIAQRGGTTSALLATDRATLLASLAAALDQAATGVTTRTVPAFASSSGSGTQLQFSTGFAVGTATTPWSGVLDRRRYICNPATLQPEVQALASSDRFHELLETNTSRTLFTVAPTVATNASGYLIGAMTPTYTAAVTSPVTPAQRGLALTPFAATNAALTAAHFGSTITAARRTAIIDWVSGVGRPKMGDIYHSSPVVVGPLRQDLADESYNLFRQNPVVANRPTVVYVGSNDGVLHAFVAEDFVVPATHPTFAGRTLTAGTELWGFVPPAVLPLLNSSTSAHAPLVDGTPVVKEVFLRRLPGQAPDGSIYRTVMVVPLRGIGVYVALDITDPLVPKFLWQFTQPDMGPSYGRPGIGQVLVTTSGGTLEERAVAILPGGLGAEDAAVRALNPAGCAATGVGKPPTTTNGQIARSLQRCWSTRGRSLTFIDFATGDALTRLTTTTFDSPLAGGVSLFPGDVGTVATRAFVTDQDGVMWRVDLSQPTIGSWTASSFYDLFIGGTADAGQPAFEAPVVSTDLEGYPVILQATGDIDALDGIAANRVASVTEKTTCVGALCSWTSTLNWEARLAAGEQVTGPLQLFDGKLYFATFSSQNDPTNACEIGASRLWGVEYLKSTTVVSQPTPYPAGGIEYPAASGVYVQKLSDVSNAIIMGVGITQRPTCFSGVTETDAYSGGTRYRHAAVGGGEFQLVAQVSGGTGAVASAVTTITRTLTPPAALTSIQSWTGSID
jgi:type IV pilus assembly protein PilY1